MQQMRQVASAYYANSPDAGKELFNTFFRNMDTDGNGKISHGEFRSYVDTNCPEVFGPDLFAELDNDGNGYLDFQEVITLCYMVTLRKRWCKGCGKFIKDVYFTCYDCFKRADGHSYDICLDCYRNKSFLHQHQVFFDNYAIVGIAQNELRKSKEERGQSGSSPHTRSVVVPNTYSPYPANNPYPATPNMPYQPHPMQQNYYHSPNMPYQPHLMQQNYYHSPNMPYQPHPMQQNYYQSYSIPASTYYAQNPVQTQVNHAPTEWSLAELLNAISQGVNIGLLLGCAIM